MIEKFLCIKNIGRFRDCKAAGEVAFRKMTLIYAENGRGKTTLCAILRSLQSGRPEPILERRTLGAKDPSSVQLRLNGTTVSFSNNTWTSVHPDIAVFDSVFDLGDSRTLPGTPCFRTALSSGDRSALALAFFLATLKHDARIANKIAVFDDPLSSLDRFRRTCTQQLIRQQSKVAHQVIVLSHDPHFLKLVWDGCASTDGKTLQLTRKGNNTVLSEWDVEAETQSQYLKDYNRLLAFYHDGSGNKVEVVRSIRTFLEGRLRVEYPGQFAENEWLGDFTNKIRSAAASSPLNHAKADLAEIEAVKDYSKKYHHDQSLRAGSEPISDAELRGYVKRTLKLAGAC